MKLKHITMNVENSKVTVVTEDNQSFDFNSVADSLYVDIDNANQKPKAVPLSDTERETFHKDVILERDQIDTKAGNGRSYMASMLLEGILTVSGIMQYPNSYSYPYFHNDTYHRPTPQGQQYGFRSDVRPNTILNENDGINISNLIRLVNKVKCVMMEKRHEEGIQLTDHMVMISHKDYGHGLMFNILRYKSTLVGLYMTLGDYRFIIGDSKIMVLGSAPFHSNDILCYRITKYGSMANIFNDVYLDVVENLQYILEGE